MTTQLQHTKRLLFLVLLLCCGVFVSAQSTYQEAEKLLETPYHVKIANPEKHISECKKLIPQLKREEHEAIIAKLYCSISLALYYQAKYEESTSVSLQAIEIFERLGMKAELGGQLGSLGYQMKRRNLEKAFEYMRSGISILKQTDDIQQLCSNIDNYGVLFEMNNQPDSALRCYKQALSLKESINDTVGIPYSLNKIGIAFVLSGNYKKAKGYLDSAYAMRIRIHDKMGIAENLSFYGDYYRYQGLHQDAIPFYSASLDSAKSLNYPYLVQYNAEMLSQCFEALKKSEQALTYFKLFTSIKDSVLTVKKNQAIAALEIQYETEKNEKELAVQKVKVTEAQYKIKRQTTWMIGLSAVFVALLVIAYLVYKQTRLRAEKLEAENYLKDELHAITVKSNLQKERLRISRDLHDNIGSQLTFIISSLDNHKFLLKKESFSTDKIEEIALFARDTISQLRDTIWAMNKGSIPYDDFVAKVREYTMKAQQLVPDKQIKVQTSFQEDGVLNAIESINFFRIIQEAIQNAIKYADCSSVLVDLQSDTNEFSFRVSDNGIGFCVEENQSSGNGISNMHYRAQEVNAAAKIISSESGTSVSVRLEKNTA